nr:MAG TPA: hypothetical protein [Bacteriophage sp.]
MEMAQFIGFYLLECNRFQNGKGSSKNNPVGRLHNTNGVPHKKTSSSVASRRLNRGHHNPAAFSV